MTQEPHRLKKNTPSLLSMLSMLSRAPKLMQSLVFWAESIRSSQRKVTVHHRNKVRNPFKGENENLEQAFAKQYI
jgi:hypothetical protein